MAHETYQEMLAGRALDALDHADLRELDEHLASCAECQTALAELEDSAALLAYAAPPAEPRAEVGTRIMEFVRAGKTKKVAEVVDLPKRVPTRWPNWMKLAAAIAILILGLGGFAWWYRGNQLREIDRLTKLVEDRNRELRQQQEKLQQEQEVRALLASPGTKRAELIGTKESPEARAIFAFNPQTGRSVLMTEGLKPAPPDKDYEVWFLGNGQPMRGGVFTVDASGRATILDQVPPEARSRSMFAVTLEPKGGVNAPTGPLYLVSPVS